MRFSFIFHFLPFISLSFANQIVMNNDDYVPERTAQPSLTDLLTIESSASIFFSYARELELSTMFGNTALNLTLLVPNNKAVMALSRKPHEGNTPIDEGIIITDEEFDNLSKTNVEHWISAHIIPESPINMDSKTYETLLQGKSITFKRIGKGKIQNPDWSQVTLENGIHIVGMREASNGVLYLIDGTVATE